MGQGPADPYQAPNQAQYQPPYGAPYVAPNEPPYQTPYQGPFVPPAYTGRGSSGSARVLAAARADWGGDPDAVGLLILLHQFDWFSGRIFEFSWPILLIGLGVWLIVRRLSETKGSSQENSKEGNHESLHSNSPIACAGILAVGWRDCTAGRGQCFELGPVLPLFLILAGVLLLAERAAWRRRGILLMRALRGKAQRQARTGRAANAGHRDRAARTA